MRINSFVKTLLNSVRPTLKRFWASVGLTVALTTTLIMLVNVHGSSETLARLSMALFSGILTSWCVILMLEQEHLVSEFTGNLIALSISALVISGVYVLLKNMTLVSTTRYVAFCIFLFLMFFVIPGFRRANGLEMYLVKLFSQAVISILFAAVLFIGLSAITFTFSALFSLNVYFETYVKIWLVMVGVVAPFLFMAGIPSKNASLEIDDYPTVLKNLVVYVVTPLLTAYTLILYLYFAKILITRQWPVGLVAHLVLWYSMLSTAVLYFVWPLTHKQKWANTFARYFPRVVIPLLLMMFLSLGIRVRHYGITENRYYVAIAGLWILGSMIYLSVTKTRKSVLLPATLAILVMLSVFGPWSSFSVSKWNQNQRFNVLLNKYDMIQDGSIVFPSREISKEDGQEIVSILVYFERNHDLSDVNLLPADFTMDEFESVFGFSRFGDVTIPKFLGYNSENKYLDIDGYQYLFDYTTPSYDQEEFPLSTGNFETVYNRERQTIRVIFNGKVECEQSLAQHVGNLLSEYGTDNNMDLLPEDMIITGESDTLRFKIVIKEMHGELHPTSQEVSIHHIGFLLLVGEK
jgi:hypothetical protein